MTRARDLADFNLDGKAVTINESSADLDFRVEGNGNANAFFVQGSDDFIGIGTGTPKKKVHIQDTTSDGMIILDMNGTTTDHQICFAQNYQSGSQSGGNYYAIGVDGSENKLVFAFDANAQASLSADAKMVLNSSGQVGINTSSPSGANLEIFTGSTTSDGLKINRYSSGVYYSTLRQDSHGLAIHVGNGSSIAERAAITPNGITFNGDTAAANALDDYEEGTYTPQISATDGIGTLTYSAQVGRYTKVGNRVSFNSYIAIANKGTVAGSLRITLPFTVKNVANNHTAFSWYINSAVSGQRFDGDTMQFCFASPNSSIALPYGSNGGGGVDLLNAAHVQNGTDMMVSGTYEV